MAKLTSKQKKLKDASKTSQLDAIKHILISLLDQCKLTFDTYSDADYTKDLGELVKRLDHEGISFATRTLPILSEGMFHFLETGKSKYPGFACIPSKYPYFLKRLFRLVYKGVPDVDAIAMIYQISVAFKKLKGPYRHSELESQLRDFIDVDNELVHQFKEPDELIIEHARAFITKLFEGLSESDFINRITPRPGPGATNTKRPHHLRYIPAKVYEQVDAHFPVYEWFYNSYNHMTWNIPLLKELYKNSIKEQTSRFRFVDKVVGKARGICIEENEVQFLQQGVKDFLYKWVENHPLTKGKVNFTDQSINAKLALESSFSRTLATLDMKEASDRISRYLVGELFRDIPFIRDALLCLSTRTITFPDEFGFESLKTNKYAPMGSGLCFPVMSLVHYALIYSILYLSMHPDTCLSSIFVYGDDILVPTDTAQAVFDWLPRFGMKFNLSKSFVRSHFRESCGTHAYNGVDITPVYFKYTTCDSGSPTILRSLIANEYDLWNKGYWIVCEAIRIKTNVKTFVTPYSNVVGWKRPPILQYNHCGMKRRYSQAFHCVQYRCTVFKTRYEDTYDFDEDSALTRWYLIKANAHTNHGLDSKQKFGSRWVNDWHMVT